jgi:two-component system, cell cycle sensor histidine kinase and response regulator CckA
VGITQNSRTKEELLKEVEALRKQVEELGVAAEQHERVESELRQQETKYRKIFENLQDIFYQVDISGKIIDVSPSVFRYSGYTREELVGKSVVDLYAHPIDRERFLQAVSITGEVSDYEISLKDKWGKVVETSINARLLKDASGKPVGVEGTFRDISARKRTEGALRANEELYRLLFYQSPVGIFHFDNDLRVTDFNEQFVGLLKSTRALLKGLDLNAIKDRRVLPAIREAIGGRESVYEGPYEATTSSAQVWVMMKTAPLFDENGRVRGGIGIVEDFTKRREAAREIFMLAQALRSIRDCVSITDLEDKVLFVNEAFSKIYGYSPEEIVGKSISLVRSASNPRSVVEQILPATLKGGWEGEILNRRKDNTEFPVYLSTSVVRDGDGKTIALIGAATDITERRRADSNLRESEEKFRSLVDTARDVIFTATPRGVITSLNQAFETSTGWSRAEWLGKTYYDLFHNEDVEGSRQYFIRALEGVKVPVREIRIHRKGGGYVVGEFTITPQKERGKIVGLIGVARDVTERKRLEDQYRHAQKMESLGTLAGGIAHDFNNILAIILGHASLIPRNQGNPAKQTANIDAVIQASHRGAALVRQLLTFASKSDILFESVQLNEVITETTRLLGETFPKTIVVRLQLEENLPTIVADPNQLHQLLLNLCINARDAMPRGGTLSIRATFVGGEMLSSHFPNVGAKTYVVLQVSDTGHGMDLATKRRIFEPFFTTKEKGKGTGLGLATVYGIVESHGGFVDVDSELGVGSTFHVYFPTQVIIEEATASQGMSTDDVPGGTETILIVEDEEMLREMLKTVLSSKGYQVLTASDGIEAVEIYALHRQNINLVVADIGLPRLAGSEVFLRLKQSNPGIRVVLASGFLEPALKTEMIKAGAKEVIQKPYQPNEFLKSVRKALDS